MFNQYLDHIPESIYQRAQQEGFAIISSHRPYHFEAYQKYYESGYHNVSENIHDFVEQEGLEGGLEQTGLSRESVRIGDEECFVRHRLLGAYLKYYGYNDFISVKSIFKSLGLEGKEYHYYAYWYLVYPSTLPLSEERETYRAFITNMCELGRLFEQECVLVSSPLGFVGKYDTTPSELQTLKLRHFSEEKLKAYRERQNLDSIRVREFRARYIQERESKSDESLDSDMLHKLRNESKVGFGIKNKVLYLSPDECQNPRKSYQHQKEREQIHSFTQWAKFAEQRAQEAKQTQEMQETQKAQEKRQTSTYANLDSTHAKILDWISSIMPTKAIRPPIGRRVLSALRGRNKLKRWLQEAYGAEHWIVSSVAYVRKEGYAELLYDGFMPYQGGNIWSKWRISQHKHLTKEIPAHIITTKGNVLMDFIKQMRATKTPHTGGAPLIVRQFVDRYFAPKH